ncbi:hypothetical protein [Streptomyces sp. SYSU K217416]
MAVSDGIIPVTIDDSSTAVVNEDHDYMSGRLDSVEFGQPASLSSLTFQIPNMPRMYGDWLSDKGKSWSGRSAFRSVDWSITVDARGDHRDIIKELRRVGGYAATHTGTLERNDGKSFTLEEAKDKLALLRTFLGFAFGRSISPFLPVGFDADDAPVWCDWSVYPIDPWAGVHQISDQTRNSDFIELFGRFADAWTDPYRREVAHRAAQYFVKSNDGRPVEVATSISQAGLELMAWSNSCTGGKASDRITSLLGILSQAPAVPHSLSHLNSRALRENPSATGPQMITRMRNKIIHPKRGDKLFNFDEWIDAWQLSQEYLALSVLHYVGYKGSYRSFLSPEKSMGTVTRVPWV